MSDFQLFDIPAKIDIESLDKILIEMNRCGGSDLKLYGENKGFASVYGRLVPVTKRKLRAGELQDLLKQMYDIHSEALLGRGDPINDAYEVRVGTVKEGVEHVVRSRYRMNAVSCERFSRKSLSITLRSIPTMPPSPDEISLEKEILEAFTTSHQGLFPVIGGTGNGKSTLLAAILRHSLEQENANRTLVTIEEPIEFVYDDVIKPSSLVTQIQVGRDLNSFDAGIVNALRMDPTDILVSESRDVQTITAAIDGSRTGHNVFTTIHANDIPGSIQRIEGMFDAGMQGQAREGLIEALGGMVAQRLVPTVDGKRTAIREFLLFDEQMKMSLMGSKNIANDVRKLVNSYGMPMIDSAKKSYESGKISKEEFKRLEFSYGRNTK